MVAGTLVRTPAGRQAHFPGQTSPGASPPPVVEAWPDDAAFGVRLVVRGLAPVVEAFFLAAAARGLAGALAPDAALPAPASSAARRAARASFSSRARRA